MTPHQFFCLWSWLWTYGTSFIDPELAADGIELARLLISPSLRQTGYIIDMALPSPATPALTTTS
ncbi:hypothetical protein Shyd_59110 [Streptomyces hydrogenans]|uniref:Uncharacterized protein n=1 Tax=Streptomyces hydrogenans TaxID=1873719 RepID=A0ABQ3PHN7_9ACTN|nr:hypothetical protein [Streptomyces hydrogenans]GHI24540.1 hypothetical protein Shyd_59110 [Streptomyces hydrogenans]